MQLPVELSFGATSACVLIVFIHLLEWQNINNYHLPNCLIYGIFVD